MKKILEKSDFNSFPRLNESMLWAVDEMMRSDITELMKKIPHEQQFSNSEKISDELNTN